MLKKFKLRFFIPAVLGFLIGQTVFCPSTATPKASQAFKSSQNRDLKQFLELAQSHDKVPPKIVFPDENLTGEQYQTAAYVALDQIDAYMAKPLPAYKSFNNGVNNLLRTKSGVVRAFGMLSQQIKNIKRTINDFNRRLRKLEAKSGRAGMASSRATRAKVTSRGGRAGTSIRSSIRSGRT